MLDQVLLDVAAERPTLHAGMHMEIAFGSVVFVKCVCVCVYLGTCVCAGDKLVFFFEIESLTGLGAK